MSFLLDTDICSAHLKGDRQVSSRFLQYSGRLNISVLTASELYTWANRRTAPPLRLTAVRDMLFAARLLDVDRHVAESSGEFRAVLLDQGKPIPSVDLFIAATAMLHDLTLVTHNVRHFQSVPGLRIVDWLAP
jgi:tRNA(fMet)-specific endonuclease VapC